ncbi:MAG: hypothetical protein QG599_746 [Pseudomonadota bacterium]|nr:hypothetical protein [Pseudomonadota bacterium]
MNSKITRSLCYGILIALNVGFIQTASSAPNAEQSIQSSPQKTESKAVQYYVSRTAKAIQSNVKTLISTATKIMPQLRVVTGILEFFGAATNLAIADEPSEQTRQEVETLQNRLNSEFAILGDDLRNQHAAEMTAIQNNLQEILKVGQAVEQVNLKLTDISNQLISISASLANLSTKVDQIQNTLTAQIRADFDGGVGYLELYERTGKQERKHLEDALTSLTKFKDTLTQLQGQHPDNAQQLALAYYFLAATYTDLHQATQNTGYADAGLAQFTALADQSVELPLLSATYLAIRNLDANSQAAGRLKDRYLHDIRQSLKAGQLDQARQQANTLHLLVINEESTRIQTAVADYIAQGHDASGLLNIDDPIYTAIRRCLNGCELSSLSSNLPDYVRSLATKQPLPADFQTLLAAYASEELAQDAVRQLIKRNYHQDALAILRDHGVGDDDFRIKAYLVIYDRMGMSKRDELKKLVLSNPAYSQEVKTFAAKIGGTSGT